MYRLLLLSLSLGLVPTSDAGARSDPPPFCEHPRNCSSQQYGVIQSLRCQKACIPNDLPPGEPLVDCRYSSGSYQCQVWPRGDELSYAYWVSPPLQLPVTGPTYSPTFSVECSVPNRGGALVVTVTSPYGMSSSTSISLSCQHRLQN